MERLDVTAVSPPTLVRSGLLTLVINARPLRVCGHLSRSTDRIRGERLGFLVPLARQQSGRVRSFVWMLKARRRASPPLVF